MTEKGAQPGTTGRRARRSLTEGSVLGHLFRFIVPMSIGLSAMMATALINAFWLGRLSTDAVAAVTFAFPVMFAVMSVSIGLASGAVAAVSRVAASGDHERVRRLAADAMLLAVVIVIAVSIAGAFLARPMFHALGARDHILDLSTVFMQIWFAGNLFVVIPSLGNAMLRAVGEAVLPSLLMTLAAVANMILDPIFIFGWGPIPRLEVAGAAIATVLANAIAAAAVMWVVIFREKIIAFSLPPMKVLVRHWKEILHVGLPAMGSNMVNPVGLAIVVAGLARFGTDVVAGYGAAARVESFAILPLFALSAAIGPMTGQNKARGFPERVRESFRASFVICIGWSLALAVLLAALAPLVAPVFLPDADAQAAMRWYLWIVPISTWGYGIVIAAAAGFNGMSKPIPGLVMTIARSAGLMIGFAWIGGTLWGPNGAFAGLAAANVISGIVVGLWTLSHALPRGTHAAPTPVAVPAIPEPAILDAAATEH